MNDQVALSGLARQLVIAGLLDEKSAQQAQQQAQRNKLSLVTYLVKNKLVKSRPINELHAEQFGIAL
jgi:type IV pilus assembly protein PilB